KDARLYNAAKKLADCWYDNLVVKNHPWYDGHEEMEQACYRLAAYVNKVEGAGKGDKYAKLARFLLDCRGHGSTGPTAAGGDFFTGAGNGSAYDQTFLPVTQQYTAVGHAVRAVYLYSAMTAEARRSSDPQYLSAVDSLWSDLVNKKMYLTGGVGSGETSEGFGTAYSLPNNAYCESCAGAGMLFFQHQMNLLYGDAKYADLYEDVIYNALLSDIDLNGQNFTYTNSLDTDQMRYKWHVCPCCVGNIPRVLLSLPTWMYTRQADGLAVNLFVGSTTTVPDIASTDVQVTQSTNYPWDGKVTLQINPDASKQFALRIRVPKRDASALYRSTPEVSGIESLQVNGQPVKATFDKGYAVLDRTWKAGDKVEFVLPMRVQRVTADPQVAADRNKVALRYGPLIFNFESVDQPLNHALGSTELIQSKWSPTLLDGVISLHGKFSDGTEFQAIPNFARNNRGGRSVVWMPAAQ
ncbi:MAG: glycoside hydrolase family 127 protein, partial [Tepidisphaeraceae bacterium]